MTKEETYHCIKCGSDFENLKDAEELDYVCESCREEEDNETD